MKISKKLLEEKVNNEIKENNNIIGYCKLGIINLPFPGIIIAPVILVLSILSAKVSGVFFIIEVAFIIYTIIAFIKFYKHYIIVFLQDNIKLFQVEGNNLDVVNTQTYSYGDVLSVQILYSKNLYITFTDDKSKVYSSRIKSTNSSFTLKEFDVKKFCEEKKTENK